MFQIISKKYQLTLGKKTMTDILMPLMCENINARDLQNKSEHAKRTLNHYLFEWDKTYNDQIQTVELFDTKLLL